MEVVGCNKSIEVAGSSEVGARDKVEKSKRVLK